MFKKTFKKENISGKSLDIRLVLKSATPEFIALAEKLGCFSKEDIENRLKELKEIKSGDLING